MSQSYFSNASPGTLYNSRESIPFRDFPGSSETSPGRYDLHHHGDRRSTSPMAPDPQSRAGGGRMGGGDSAGGGGGDTSATADYSQLEAGPAPPYGSSAAATIAAAAAAAAAAQPSKPQSHHHLHNHHQHGNGGNPPPSPGFEPVRLPFHHALRKPLYVLLFGSRLNLFLVFVPLTFLANSRGYSQGTVFLLSLLSLLPLAERLGFITEQLSACTGPAVSGLIGATFSNAPELIVVLVALRSGLVRVIQLSLLGSILGNLLLCLGSAFLAGGLCHRRLRFNRQAAQMNCGALLLASSGLLFPNLLHATQTELHEDVSELWLSRFAAVLMLIAYACYVHFQVVTHADWFAAAAPSPLPTPVPSLECLVCGEEGYVARSPVPGGGGNNGDGNDDDDDEEEIVLGLWGGVVALAVVTAVVSTVADFLVNSVEAAAEQWQVPISGLCVVVLPVVNNVVEHAAAITFAMRNKLDLSLATAVGSSVQLSMFLLPLSVVTGWAIGTPMDLNFHRFETITLFITVLATVLTLHENDVHWLKGVMLVFMYFILAATFFNHREEYLSPVPAHPTMGVGVDGAVGAQIHRLVMAGASEL